MDASITVHLQIFKRPQLLRFSTDLDETGIEIHGLFRSFISNIVIIRVAIQETGRFKFLIVLNYFKKRISFFDDHGNMNSMDPNSIYYLTRSWIFSAKNVLGCLFRAPPPPLIPYTTHNVDVWNSIFTAKITNSNFCIPEMGTDYTETRILKRIQTPTSNFAS